LEDERIEFDKWCVFLSSFSSHVELTLFGACREVFFTDDTIAPHDGPSSTCSAYSSFFRRVPLPSNRIHVVKSELLAFDPGAPPTQTCERVAVEMEEQLSRAFGGGGEGPPRFDLVLLGIGKDGALLSRTVSFCVPLTLPNRRLLRLSPSRPSRTRRAPLPPLPCPLPRLLLSSSPDLHPPPPLRRPPSRLPHRRSRQVLRSQQHARPLPPLVERRKTPSGSDRPRYGAAGDCLRGRCGS
jgi:hypothetical protein